MLNEKSFGSSRGSSELATHLSHHGVNVVVDEVDAAGRTIGEVLAQFVASNKIDLLVMGAYGHSRFREFILGGATQSMLSKPPVPTLLRTDGSWSDAWISILRISRAGSPV